MTINNYELPWTDVCEIKTSNKELCQGLYVIKDTSSAVCDLYIWQ